MLHISPSKISNNIFFLEHHVDPLGSAAAISSSSCSLCDAAAPQTYLGPTANVITYLPCLVDPQLF